MRLPHRRRPAPLAPTPEPVPEHRRAALGRVAAALRGAQRVVLTTHVNADGDGAGSEAALAAWLRARGASAVIVNPTPFPDVFRYLLPADDWVADLGTPAANAALAAADLLAVVDTSEPRRIGKLARDAERLPVVVIDHHEPPQDGIAGTVVEDASACATGELVYDLLVLEAASAEPWPAAALEGLYAAIVTDTGSFRFANATPRAHRIAADLIARGVDPELAYRRLFATVTLTRLRLLQDVLEHLESEPDTGLSWISLPLEVMNRHGAASEDLDGIIEHARSIAGTEVAILFRELEPRTTKISWRSTGDVDVNALARAFGGGGHVKAAGALIGKPLASARADVLAATRDAVRRLRAASPDARFE